MTDSTTTATAPPSSRPTPESRRRGKRRGGGEDLMVPEVEFTSYYGRPVVKPAPWHTDIAAYLFLGGLAGGSSLLAAGADLTGRDSLRRVGRIGGLVGIGASFAALVHDLGRPSRFTNMLRVFKPTSPMSVGTWILTGYGPLAGLAGAAEISTLIPLPAALRGPARVLRTLARPAGIAAALLGPAVASYTAVLLTDTATPTWSEARHDLPFVFVGSAAGAAGGLGLLAARPADTGPARRLAVAGGAFELLAERKMEAGMGITAEPLHSGKAGTLLKLSKGLTIGGVLGGAVGGLLGRGRWANLLTRLSGAALLGGSACLRYGVFFAGLESAKDPKYTVVPQRERLASR